MEFHLKGTFINIAVSCINVDTFEEGTNLVAVISKVFPLVTFYLFIFLQ